MCFNSHKIKAIVVIHFKVDNLLGTVCLWQVESSFIFRTAFMAETQSDKKLSSEISVHIDMTASHDCMSQVLPPST